MWKWVLISMVGFIGLYVVMRVLSSAIFRSYFEVKQIFNGKEDTNGYRQESNGRSIKKTN